MSCLGWRVSARQTVVETRIINQAFTWNDLGQLASLGYPNDTALADAVEPPRTVSYTYTNAALTAVPSYLSSISYHPNGMVNTVTHANGTRVVHGKDANDMARPASITLQRVSDSAVLWQTGAFAYDGAGNIKTLGSDWTTYDGVNRLTVGTASAGALRQCTSYNAFGALTGLGTGTTSCTPSAISVDAATNRLASPVTYDAAGNMTAWGGKTYSWTRDNQMLTTTGTGINRSYAYTADGERSLDRNNLDSTRTLWIRDLSGKVLREYARSGAGVWSWGKDYVLRDGQQAATVTAAATRHLHLDHLGTVRRMTDTQATPQLVAAASRDLYPFGLEATSSTDPERMRFTGHQRDTQGTTAQADDVDYMHARYYNPTVGRFLSIDPVRGNPRTPQSWNLYSYVQNNPVNKTDPDGKLAWVMIPATWVFAAGLTATSVYVVTRPEVRAHATAALAATKARLRQEAEKNKLQGRQTIDRIKRQQHGEGPRPPVRPTPPPALAKDQPGSDKAIPEGWNLPAGLGTLLKHAAEVQAGMATFAIDKAWAFLTPTEPSSGSAPPAEDNAHPTDVP